MSRRPLFCAHVALLCLTALCFAPSTLYAAGAWSQQPGEFYAKVWNTTLIGNSAFDLDGEVVEVGEYALISLDYYAEVGIAPGWTILSAGKPLSHARFAGNQSNYLGPLSFGVRRSFSLANEFQLGVEVGYGLQGLSDRDLAPRGASYAFMPTVETQHGRAEVALGRGFSWGWATGSAGAKVFTNEAISPAIIAHAQVGYQFATRWTVDGHLVLNQHVGAIEETNVTGAGESNYIGVGVGLSYWITERAALSLGADGAARAVSNAAAPVFRFGFELR